VNAAMRHRAEKPRANAELARQAPHLRRVAAALSASGDDQAQPPSAGGAGQPDRLEQHRQSFAGDEPAGEQQRKRAIGPAVSGRRREPGRIDAKPYAAELARRFREPLRERSLERTAVRDDQASRAHAVPGRRSAGIRPADESERMQEQRYRRFRKHALDRAYEFGPVVDLNDIVT